MLETSCQELKVKFSASSNVIRSLYLKEHSIRKKLSHDGESKPTLLVLNVPPYCDNKTMKMLFRSCGNISSIHRQKKPGNINDSSDYTGIFPGLAVTGYHACYLTFEKRSSITQALKLTESTEVVCLSTDEYQPPCGMKKWCLDYLKSWPNKNLMQKEIDKYMEAYDKKVEEQEKMEAANEGVPDDDGWVTVTKKGRNPGVSRTEANQTRMKARIKRKKEKKDLFVYAYQIRESKREKIADLRKKFEEDKAKISEMKAARKFRPY